MDHELFDGGELRDVDPLDPAAMRALLPNMDMSAPEMLAINVGRPSDEEFFRTHPDDAFTMLNNVVEHGRRTYVVAPSMIHECGAKVRTAVLVTRMYASRSPGEMSRIDTPFTMASVAFSLLGTVSIATTRLRISSSSSVTTGWLRSSRSVETM